MTGRRLAAAATLLLLGVALGVSPAGAQTVDKTWTFLSSAESFAATPGPQSTAAWNGGTGNPAGALYTETSGRKKSNTNYWEWTGTFENLGVPPGADVSSIQLIGGFTRCTVFTFGDVSTAGPWEIWDSTGTTQLGTLWGGRSVSGVEGSWTSVGSPAAVSLGTLASATTIRIRLNNTLATGNDNAAVVRLWDDQVAVRVTYSAATPTTTVGNNLTVEPSPTTIGPGGAITDLDHFTLRTSSGNDTVNSVTVTLSPAGAFDNLQTVSITNNAGTTTHGTVTPGSNTVVVPLGTTILATTTETQYKVRITPKSHAAMPAPAGASYATTGLVTAIGHTTSNNLAYNDTTSGTITVDNLSPGAVTWGTVTPGDQQLQLTWSNPGTDYSQTVIVRKIGSAPTGTPNEGATYTDDASLGDGTVAYVGNGTSTTDVGGPTPLVNGTSYYYRAFAKDPFGNYTAFSVSQSTGPHQPAAVATITVGDGAAEPPSVSNLCPTPDGSATLLDAFSLVTNQSSDNVSAVTVSLGAGTSAALSLIEITDAAGTSSLGSATPASDTPTITLSPSPISVTTSPVEYRVRVTPKSHATWNDPTTDSADWNVTGTVTGLTAAFAKSYQDATSATLTVDNLSTADPAWGAITPGDQQIGLAWTNPDDTDFAQVLILRKGTAFTTERPSEGTTSYTVGTTIGGAEIVYYGAGESATDDDQGAGLVNGNDYHYKIFALDGCGNWSVGAATGPEQPTSQKVTAGTATATVDACDQITVSAPYTGDPNGNSSTTFEQGSGPGGPWTPVCSAVVGASPRTCVDSTVGPLTSYYYRVTFSDTDGVNGTNPRVIGPYTTPTCDPIDTTAGTLQTVAGGCRQVTASATFAGDSDGDGSTSFEFNTVNSFPGTVSCASVGGVSPRTCLVTGLSPSTPYWIQATFSDPDGVTGGPLVSGPVSTTACGGGNEAPPAILFLAPSRNATVGGIDRFKVQVFDPDGVVLADVLWSLDGAALSNAGVSQNNDYDCNAGGQTQCKVFEFDVDTTGLADGSHYVTVQAADGDTPASVGSRSMGFLVKNSGAGAAGSGRLLRRTHGAQLCIDCHNIPTHSSQSSSTQYGNWAIDCLTCHTPHRTRNLYLIRETIETPNSGAHILTFQQDDRAGGANPQKGHLGDFDPTGATGPFTDGICETCHTRTAHHRNSNAGGDHTHSIGARCATCHTHDRGFKGKGCNECHNAPPTTGNHDRHLEAGTLPTNYESTTATTTAGQYGFACAKCHTGTGHPNDSRTGASGDAFEVEVVFDASASPANPSGGYTPESYATRAEALGPDGRYWSWSDNGATCSNLYCHSNAGPLQQNPTPTYSTPIYQSPTWNSTPGALGCTGCHGGLDQSAAMSAPHARHVNSNGNSGYAFSCVKCHAGTVSDSSTIADKTKHVNAVKTDVAFDATNPSGVYSGVSHTCSTAYCHSNGQTASPAYQSPTWHNTTLDGECDSCHGNDATATVTTGVGTIASGKHTQHIDQAAVLGTNFGCVNCHDSTVSGNRTIKATTGYAFHVSGAPDVAFATIGAFSGGGYAAPNCSNVYCHSSGQATPEYYSVDWNPATTLTCKGCHGNASTPAFTSDFGEPNHAGTNSHRKHVLVATDCADCHDATTTTGTAIKAGSTSHVNGSRDVAIGAGWDQNGGTSNYNQGTQTCSSVSCHPAGAAASPVWGGSGFLCRDCHMASGAGDQDVDDYTFKNGTFARIDQEDWETYGHGATSSYVDSNNGPARFDKDFDGTNFDGCTYCHDTGVRHGETANPFRLKNAGGADGKNGACLVCHKDNTNVGVDIGRGAVESSLKVGAAHYGSSHRDNPGVGSNPDSGAGGQLCWDCHDPHGDYNYGSTQRLGYMIQEQPVRDHATDGWGVPTALAPNPSFYDVNGDRTADWGELVSPTLVSSRYRGLCQVCHTQNNRFRQTDSSTATDAGNLGRDFSLDSAHFAGQSCTASGCHEHPQQFKQLACDQCHNAPPRPGAPVDQDSHLIHYESTTLPTAYADTTGVATATEYGFACARCHSGTHINDETASGGAHDGTSGQGFSIEVAFDSLNPSGSYTPEAYANRAEDQGPGGLYYRWSDNPGTCSNLYCHSNAGPIQSSGSYATPTSTSPTWPRNDLTCTGCHGGSGASGSMSSSHAKHIDPNGSGAYNYGCVQCHDATVSNSTTIKDKTQHVNAVKTDVVFGGLSSGGGYTGASHTCSNAYCHSSGESSPTYQSPTWHNTTLDAQCDSCHGNDANATATPGVGTISSGKHTFHVDNAAVIGTNFGCVRCHSATVSGNQTIADRTQHVDGERDVVFQSLNGLTGAWASPTCSSTYCHSSGQATPTSYDVAWNGGALDCKGCHGRFGSSVNGEPDYASGSAGSATANSHTSKHIANFGGATSCANCHTNTTTTGTAIQSGSTVHIDGTRNVDFAAGGTYGGTKSCGSTGLGCHGPQDLATQQTYGANGAQWGGSPVCLSCHGTSGTETDDLGANFWSNGSMSTINTTEWTYSGHGRTSGSYDTPGDATPNPAANFANNTPGLTQCLHCHDATVDHKQSTNPFRLRGASNASGVTAAYSTADPNANCKNCHSTGSFGVNPGPGIKNGTVKMDTAHAGTKHTAATMGGKFCWDCHDPHGDRPSATNSNGNNIVMLQRSVARVTDGTHGYLGASGVAQPVEYYTKVAAVASDTGGSAVGRIVETTTALGSDHKGICQACHDPTTQADWTKYWGRTGYDDPDGSGGNAPYRSGRATTSGSSLAGHNTAAVCTTCHDHSKEFAGAGGDCLSCHGDAGGAGTQGNIGRRPVKPDFGLQSHHVGSFNFYPSQTTMGGALTNYDCVVCHAEGEVSNGETGTTAQHDNDKIDLRDVDHATNFYVYDKNNTAVMPALPSKGGSLSDWSTGNSVENDKWETMVQNNLDPFCLGCHDYNGASVHYNQNPAESASRWNPFGDAKITNEYDQVTRASDGQTATGRVTDIASHVAAAWSSGNPASLETAYSKQDRDQVGEARRDSAGFVSGRMDPPKGIYSRHSIRLPSINQADTIYTKGATTGTIPAARWVGSWNDTSTMACADCHVVDGANETTGNAHGSDSEYLLKDATGQAREGRADWAKAGTGGPYVCFKCHNETYYDATSKSYDHTGNTSDFKDTTQETPANRIASNGNFWGEACGNCHAGAVDVNGAISFGTIHGTSQKLRIQAGPSVREAYRFMSGSSMRYYNPGGWNTGASVTCFTLDNAGEGGVYGGCVQHSYTKGGGTFKSGKPVQRNLNY